MAHLRCTCQTWGKDYVDKKGLTIHKYSYSLPLKYIQLQNKHYENKVILRMQNKPLKSCQPVELLTYSGKSFMYLEGSVDQRAATLQSVKIWEWFDPRRICTHFGCNVQSSCLYLSTPNSKARFFATLWSTDPILPEGRDLNPSQTKLRVQESCSILKGFVLLSKNDLIFLGLMK